MKNGTVGIITEEEMGRILEGINTMRAKSEEEPQIQLSAKSSSGRPYKVSFWLNQRPIKAMCTCKAGEHGMLCKHVTALAAGETTMLYDSSDSAMLLTLQRFLENSELQKACCEVRKGEAALAEANRVIKQGKDRIRQIVELGLPD
jgi:uncharacterized Zn finger protein